MEISGSKTPEEKVAMDSEKVWTIPLYYISIHSD